MFTVPVWDLGRPVYDYISSTWNGAQHIWQTVNTLFETKGLDLQNIVLQRHSNLKFCGNDLQLVCCCGFCWQYLVHPMRLLPKMWESDCLWETNHKLANSSSKWRCAITLRKSKRLQFSRCGCKERMGPSKDRIEKPWKHLRGRWRRHCLGLKW